MLQELTEQEAEALSSQDWIGTEVIIDRDAYTLQEPIGRGKKGVVWRGANSIGSLRAIKLVGLGDYVDKPPLRELARASALEGYPTFARLERVGRITLGEVAAVALASEWVSGRPLDAFLETAPDAVSADLIRSYVFAITDALGALRAQNLCHDDLNLGNVMVAEPLPGLREPAFSFKVIDLGSLKPTELHNTGKKHGIDDYRWIALHLVAMHNVCRRRYDLTPRERAFLTELVPIIRSLLENDPLHRIADPGSLYSLVENAWRRTGETAGAAVREPFEYISADQIADDSVLLQLFADSLPWLQRVNSSTAQIVTGPRGCGKSTVFRWLALRTHLSSRHTPVDAADTPTPTISGFYISAGVELQSRLSWISREEDAQALAPEIVHLFNLILIREVIKTMAFIDELPNPPEDLICSRTDSVRIRDYLQQQVLFEEVPLFQGVGILRQLSRHLNRHLFQTHQRLIRRQIGDRLRSTPATLPDFTELIRSAAPRFRSHPIVFLIDDFSTHRVPTPVQEVLHDVVWLRAASHTFKLSAEKSGVHVATHGGRTAELAREYIEVDCGAIMLEEASSASVHRFAVQLLDMRLTACGYSADGTTLLGPSIWPTSSPSGKLPDFLWEYAQSGRKGQKPAAYYGTSCIADLCSGDVAALLLIYENIFRKGRVDRTTTKTIPKRIQNDAIVAVSRQLVAQLRDYYSLGPHLHAFADRFGVFVGEMLRRAKRQGTQQVEPVQIPRIEVDGYADALSAIEADEEACRIFDELLRRAVLIDVDPGSARHDHTTSLRLHLRKIFLPAFGAALGKNRALVLKPEEFVFALRAPNEAFGAFLRKYVAPLGGLFMDDEL